MQELLLEVSHGLVNKSTDSSLTSPELELCEPLFADLLDGRLREFRFGLYGADEDRCGLTEVSRSVLSVAL